jgi:4-carboxymuconolactone decarboxylase
MWTGRVTTPRPASPDPGGSTPGPTVPADVLRYLADVDACPAWDAHLGVLDGRLDDRTAALARLAALVAVQSAPASYARAVEHALAGGATVDDVLSTLVVVARSVGLARVVSAAPGLALALGYDVDDALEGLDGPRGAGPPGPGW